MPERIDRAPFRGAPTALTAPCHRTISASRFGVVSVYDGQAIDSNAWRSEMLPADIDEMAGLLGDPEVMRYHPAPKTHEQAAAWITWNERDYAAHGYESLPSRALSARAHPNQRTASSGSRRVGGIP